MNKLCVICNKIVPHLKKHYKKEHTLAFQNRFTTSKNPNENKESANLFELSKVLQRQRNLNLQSRRIVKDYGTPNLSKDFFQQNPLKALSAARLLYSLLLAPEIEEQVSVISRRFISRGREEEQRINREKNPENLILIMEQQPDPTNQYLLKERILEYTSFAIPKIIEKLKDNQDGTFVELAISIIYKSKGNWSAQLLETLKSINDPYTLSLVCLLLGLLGSRAAIQPVWNYFYYFKENYYNRNYEQGPLLALYEFYEKKEEERIDLDNNPANRLFTLQRKMKALSDQLGMHEGSYKEAKRLRESYEKTKEEFAKLKKEFKESIY